jgi:hypothetical protein
MRKQLLMAVLVASFCVPAVGVQAGVGNGTSSVPPGLIRAQQKTWDAYTRQIQKEEQKYARKMDRLLPLLEEALFFGDFDGADKIQRKIDKETAKHERKMAKLELKRAEKWQKFDDKMAAFLLKHAEEEEEEEPPAEP